MPALLAEAGPSALFDGQALVAWAPIDVSAAPLDPQELAPVATAVRSRQIEYATGRRIARRLLGHLGVAGDAAPHASPRRDPVWPAGVVGSIAHCRGTCVVAVARRSALLALGVDVEPDEPLEDELWPTVCTREEMAWLHEHDLHERGRLARLVFSAKESVYKCLFPVVGRIFGFEELSLTFDQDTGSFRADPRGPHWAGSVENGEGAMVRVVEGRWTACRGLFLTAAFISGTKHD